MTIEVTREQLQEALREKLTAKSATDKTIEAGKSFLGGGSSGATGLLSLPFEIVNLPNTVLNYLAGVNEPTATQKLYETMNVPKEPPEGVNRIAYNFGEGAIPAAATTYAATRNVPISAGAGLLGGVTNVGAKYYFPESPVGQMLFSSIPGVVSGLTSAARNRVPKGAAATTSEETGITTTPGQRTGSQALLREEAAVAKTAEGEPIFRTAGLANVQNAEEFASKIQQFSTNPNLTTTQIANGVQEAMNYQNNRVLNKFRVENRKNFNAAKQEAGDSRIFNTDNVNAELDKAIAIYGADGMPPDLQAFARKLQEVKSGISKPTVFEGQTVNTPLTIDELQKNLEFWGKAAKTGTYSDGTVNLGGGNVTPGTLKTLSRNVLNAFKEDLNAANLEGVPGAQKLINARDQYKAGLKEVNDFQNQTLVKYFGNDTLDPTAVVERLQNATPTERVTMFKVLESSRPEVLDSLRSRALNDVITNANGDMSKLLSSLKDITKQTSEAGAINTNDFLFPTKAEKAKANVLIRDLDSITRQATGAAEGGMNRIPGEVVGAGLGFKARMVTNTVMDAIDVISGATANPQKLAWLMTNPDGQTLIRDAARLKEGQKLPNAMKSKLDYLSSDALIGGSVSVSNIGAARESGQITQPPVITTTQEELQQELLRRQKEGQ